MPIASRALRYATDDRLRYSHVATNSGGSTAAAASASSGERSTRNTNTPTEVIAATTAVTSPVWMSCESASTSVVMRVMIRPSSSRS